MNTYNQIDFTRLKPVGYFRKSSSSEDRQMLSIDSQKNEVERISEYYKLQNFVSYFEESKSAKKEFARPEFMKMIEIIRNNQADCIVCWKLDRLARNMSEGGMLIDLLSSGVIRAIITHDKVYYPTDNVLLMSMEFGQGKQFVKDLSINVKRGQKKKASLGVPHGVASLGFLNDRTEDKGNRKWMVDEERLWKIEKLFKLFLTGRYSAGKLYKYAINELKLTTVKRKRIGGGIIANSRIYELLKDPIYAGFFFYNGERYELDRSLPRLITEEEHEKIKQFLSRKNIPKTQHHKALYAGYISSEENDFMGPDFKFQLICDCKHKFAYRSKTNCPKCGIEIDEMNNPKYMNKSYYYNVRKKKKGIKTKYLSEEKIDGKIISFIDENLNFSNDLVEWSKKYIQELKNKEISEKILISKDKENRKKEYELKKSKLRGLLRDEKITDKEYNMDLSILAKEYSDINNSKKENKDWYKEMLEIVDLTSSAIEIFKKGSFDAKRNILSKLGSNLTWNEEKLNINNRKSINALVKGIQIAKATNPKFEPKLSFAKQGLKEKTEPPDPVFSTMLPLLDAFRTLNWNKIEQDLEFSGILSLYPNLSLQNL